MKKHNYLIKILSAILLLSFLTGMLAITASADTRVAELTYLDDWMNLAIQVVYTDNGSGLPPEISFISPGGREYKAGVSSESEIQAEYFDAAILYMIPNAQPGQWQICYDSAFSGHLEVTCSPYSRQIEIESFHITEMNSSNANLEFYVGFDEDVQFNYIVSAVVADEYGNVESSRVLKTGRLYSNRTHNLKVYLDDLSSFDRYQLQLEVYYNDNGIETGDTRLTDPFAYVDPNAPDALGDFWITLDRTAGMLYLDWSNVDTWRADEYIVAVFVGKDQTEPVYYENMDDSITSTSALVDPEADAIRVDLYWRYNGNLSNVKSVTFDPKQVELEIMASETTAAAQTQLRYAVPGGLTIPVLISVNDRQVLNTQLTDSGMMPVELAEGENLVMVAHWLTEYICVKDSKEIFSDRRPPVLSFFENVDGITTSDPSFRLVGMTEAGATLTVNGVSAVINPDGTFTLDLGPMVSGENSFEIISSDAVGNQIRRIVIINYAMAVADSPTGQWHLTDYLPIVIALLGSLLIAVLVLFIFVNKGKPMTAAIVCMRFAVSAWGATLASGIITLLVLIEKTRTGEVLNSLAFFEYAQQSVQKAYEIMQDYERLADLLRILAIMTLILGGISLILTLIALLLRCKKTTDRTSKSPKPKKKKPVKDDPAQEQAPAVAPAVENLADHQEQNPAPAVTPPTDAHKQMFCRNCGARCREGARFCNECGVKLD